MKQSYKWASLTLLIALIGWSKPASVVAQDRLTVEWIDGSGNVLVNSLWTTIAADTVAGGGRANPNRVYVLKQGGFYYLTETIENRGWHLRIEGEAGDPTSVSKNPPVIQIEHRADASNVSNMIIGQGDVTLKNLYINGKTTKDALPYETLRFDGEGATVRMDNVILEHAAWAIIGVYGKRSNIFITNSRFRNLISRTEPWGGRGISVWADVDTVYFENNSFMNVGGFAVQVEGATANYLWFNQNTVVNNGRQLFITGWWQKTFVTNNLFVNPFWHGEDETNFNPERLADADQATSGLFGIDPLPSKYGLDVQRQIVFANNAWHRDAAFQTYYTTDNDTFPLRAQPLFNGRTQKMLDKWENMVAVGNVEANPGLTTAPDNQAAMIQNITDIRRSASPITTYAWDPGRDADPAAIQWPLPENFTYSNATLKTAAFGGYPVGDLNWYPTEKATWMSARAAQVAAIKSVLSGEVSVAYLGSVEAENAVKSGDAAVVAAADRFAVRMQGTGRATWKTNIATAGTYDFEIKLRTWWDDGAADRATDLVLNTVSAAFPRGGTGADWTIAKVEDRDLVAGENTIELVKNWGYLEYESVTIKDQSGATVTTLYAAKAVIADAQLQCSGANCASGDEMATVKAGTLSFGINAPSAGQYVVKFNYRLTEGPSTNKVFNGESELASIVFGGVNNSNLQYDLYADLSAGANTIKLDAGSALLTVDKIDYYQVSTATNNENDRTVGFELAQNYPNPFNPSTAIRFTLANTSKVNLSIYNLLGQRVATLVNNTMASGSHIVNFDAKGLASGMYFYRIEAGNFVSTKKMTLVK